jgi:DNA-binding MarR family transcriptional regulator
MLFAIQLRTPRGSMLQSILRRKLGVTAATVSKMIRALEQLGFVRRRRWESGDKRQIWVELTRKASKLLRRIDRQIVRPGRFFTALYGALGFVGANVGTLKDFLDTLRTGLGDRAQLYFPWPSHGSGANGESNAIAQRQNDAS